MAEHEQPDGWRQWSAQQHGRTRDSLHTGATRRSRKPFSAGIHLPARRSICLMLCRRSLVNGCGFCASGAADAHVA